MPRWTEKQLKLAIAKVKSKEMSQNQAARVYGIPVSTLHNHVHAPHSKVGAGRPTILTYEEEKEIAYICQVDDNITMINMEMHITVELDS